MQMQHKSDSDARVWHCTYLVCDTMNYLWLAMISHKPIGLVTRLAIYPSLVNFWMTSCLQLR